MKETKIYKCLKKLDKIGHTEEIQKHYDETKNDYPGPEDYTKELGNFYSKYDTNSQLSDFLNESKIYLNFLEHEGYIKILRDEMGYDIELPILGNKGKIFLQDFDNSLSAKIDNYLGKYKNISRLFYLILGVIIGLIPYILKSIL